jgi:hypothetical protein
MIILNQENYLLYVDEIPDDLRIGEVLQAPSSGAVIRIIYIDRDQCELGFEPVGRVV